MATHCNHPNDRLTYAGSSTEDYAVGSRWPTTAHWYTCGVCGEEIPGPAPGTAEAKAKPDDDFPEHDFNEPF